MTEEKKSQQRKEIRRKRMLKYFIAATESLLREEGIHELTIRKIAQEAGYSSATLYSYFKDLDELIVFASMKYRREYIQRLSKEVHPSMSALEQYRRIYELFNYYTFRAPEIFMNMFFGKHSENLGYIRKVYYDLYPQELAPFRSEIVQALFEQNNIYDNDRSIMRFVVKEGFVKEESTEHIVRTLVRLHESYMYDLCMRDDLDPDACSAEFMEAFDWIMETNKV